MKVHIDAFQSVDTVTSKTQYEDLRMAVLRAGRFSAFEASANTHAARLYNRLVRDPAVRCTDLGYPWTKVEAKDS
jgi:hypothetical protein